MMVQTKKSVYNKSKKHMKKSKKHMKGECIQTSTHSQIRSFDMGKQNVRVPDLCPGLTPPGPLSRHGGQTFLSKHSYIVLSLQALFMWQLQQCPLVWLLRNLLSLSSPSIFLGYPILPKLSSPWGDAAKFSQQCVCACVSVKCFLYAIPCAIWCAHINAIYFPYIYIYI